MPAWPSAVWVTTMNKLPKIVITGMGAITPVGIGLEAFWKGLTENVSGIAGITRFDASALPVSRAGEVKDFNPKDFLPTRLVMDLEPFMQYAYISAEEAIAMSGLETASDRVGITMGTAMGGIQVIGDTAATLAVKGRAAGPKYTTKAMGNICAAQLSINHGIKGPSMTVSTACSSGGDALTLAVLMLRAGMADAMVVMAGEAAVCPTMIQSLTKTGALSKTGESRPFDVNRNGFVMGEGGAALVIETEAHAKARGAAILADILGCANNTDAYNPVSPEPDGSGAAACMQLALKDAGLAPEAIGYLNAHGTATAMGDSAEAAAIHKVFGTDAQQPYVSSIKGATGHMMGAGGLAELISCVMALRSGQLPVNAGMTEADPTLGLKLVTAENRSQNITAALNNSMGFGGQNSCVIVGKHEA